MRYTTKLLPSLSGNIGILQLNHPQALNALAMDMIDCFSDTLDHWYDPKSIVRAIIVKAAENPDAKRPIFCAGGDVKAIYDSRMNTASADRTSMKHGSRSKAGDNSSQPHGQGHVGLTTADFFRNEYNVNYRLATCTRIPQISIWNGIVMGGGAGISVHGKYRVATELTTFAMPETGLGLFPDVGSLYWMPRLLAGGMSAYVALTGHRLQPEDLVYTGLATHYVPSNQLPELEQALVDASQSKDGGGASTDPYAAVLMKHHQIPPVDPRDSFLAKQRADIDAAFANKSSVEDIMNKLEELDNDFGSTTLETLYKMSPTSLKITLEGLRRGSSLTIGEDLQMEFRLAQACCRSPTSDFVEGVRAILVDKDRNPHWNPANLEDVTEEIVESFFEPIESEWKVPPPTDPIESSASSKL